MKIDRKVSGTGQWEAQELHSFRREKFLLFVWKKKLQNFKDKMFCSSCGYGKS
jgi:hypothetical protein